MDPPQCVQNAMMTKDKKPFTYTPGGIDLSEVRSPRMQRRIERNANLGGAGDYPQPPQQSPPQNFGPLPPSALAALRPQTQVQVFPGPPPPPQMSRCIPPPPPPPSGPLPTQKVVTGDNQVLERPDMTKIIPDNPMAMLRKTGGPTPRKSIVEQLYEDEVQQRQPPAPPQRNNEAQSPKYQPTPPPPSVIERPAPVSTPQPQQRQSQIYQSAPVPHQQQQYQPPPTSVVERAAPVLPQQQQQQRQSQIYQTAPVPPPQQQYQPSLQQNQFASPPATQQQFQQSGYNPPVIERQSTLPRQQKNVSSNIGTLYIPPLQQQQKVASPPISPPEQHQSPGTPTLKEGPRPWQRNQQQQEIPPWAKKEELEPQVSSPPSSVNKPQNRWQPASAVSPTPLQQQPLRQNQPGSQFSARPDQIQQPSPQPRTPQTNPQNSFPVRIEIRTGGYQPSSSDEELISSRNPNAVYITQPIVLQHPGGGPGGQRIDPPYKAPTQQQQPQFQQQQIRQQQQQQQTTRVETTGTRIIPIQIEGGNSPVGSPGVERNLNRQQSWGNNNNNNQPPQSNTFKIIQKYTKTDDEDDKTPITKHSPRYTQEMPEQMRRMRINNDNGHLFRPGSQQNNIQPQPQAQQRNENGNGPPQAYIHPSEQVVPEPKKYMGSNIPSRSFKILQAMTAPSENSANANNNNEEYSPYNHHRPFTPYSFPFYPPVHAFWPDYYNNYYRQEEKEEEQSETIKIRKNTHERSGRGTPLIPVPVPPPPPPPYWGCFPPPFPPKLENASPNSSESSNDYQKFEEFYASMYPPYFFHYYYGFPQFMPPHYSAYYPTETQEYSGYSSSDELINLKKRRNSLDNNSSSSTNNKVQNLTQHFEIRAKSATPRITITTPYSYNTSKEMDENDEEREEKPSSDLCRLKSIKSVQNLNIYATKDDLTTTDTDDVDEDDADDDDSTSTEESSEEITEEDDETYSEDQHQEEIPHQLSVIYEESDERAESRRSFRCNSASSETIAENSNDKEAEEDADDFLSQQSVEYKIKLFQQSSNNNKPDEKVILMDGATTAELLTTICTEKELKSEENWWDVVQDETSSVNAEIVKVSPNRTVQVDMGDEIVTVKLRNKPGRTSRNLDEENNDAFFNCAPQRSSIYEILNNEDDQEPNIIASGSLMKMDSFASQLEAIKRNSGLFDFVNNNIKVDNSTEKIIIAEEEKCIITSEAENNEEIDFWSQIKSDDDDFIPRRSSYFIEEIPENEDDQAIVEEQIPNKNEKTDDERESSVDEDEDEEAKSTETINANSLEPQTIKERIQALKNSIAEKQNSIPKLIETQTSAKSSIKSFDTEDSEGEEEEELDSGVISDISRHISDSEEFPELKKLTKYERAATHSRLFKLLQDDEDDIEEEDEEEPLIKQEDKFSKLSVRKRGAENHQLTPSRSKLNLVLLNQSNNENNADTNQINEKLVEELVQSLLKSKKSQIFKNMPKEKLYAAAVKILQEGIIDDSAGETPEEFSSLGTESSTPAQTPQEFYGDNNEYKQYYETWSDAAVEIMPSKAFKLLQKHIGANKLGSIDGIAKCPRVLSVKNVKKLLNNNSDCCSSSSSTSPFSQIHHIPQNPQTNDRTNT